MSQANGNGKHDVEQEETPREKCRRYMAVINDQTGTIYCKFRLDHCRYLDGNGNATVVLSIILNTIKLNTLKSKDRKRLYKNNFWIRLPAKQLQNLLGMKEDRQRGAVKVLEETGIIQTERRGGNAMWIRVSETKLQQVAQQDQKRGFPVSGFPRIRNGVSPDLETGKPGIPYKTNNSKRNSKGGPEVPQSPRFSSNTNGHVLAPPTSQIDPIHIANAKKLRSALQANNRQVEGAIRNWYDHLRLLQDVDGQDYQTTLEFYCNHCGRDRADLRLPSINSTKQFRKHYNWIHDVFAKHRKQTGESVWKTTRLSNGNLLHKMV